MIKSLLNYFLQQNRAGLSRMQIMEHAHLAGEDEADDDIYEDFDEYDATLDTEVSNVLSQAAVSFDS